MRARLLAIRDGVRAAAWRFGLVWPVPASRADILNYLAVKGHYQRYLEIGVQDPQVNFERIRVHDKTGVDPTPTAEVDFKMTSDSFFAGLGARDLASQFDLIFIDGLHVAEQVERDIDHSLAHLANGGTIVVHDCNPLTEREQEAEYDGVSLWKGSVWKAWVKLRVTREDLSMFVVDIDHGCGVIWRGKQERYSLEFESYAGLDYAVLERDRRGLLNLITPREFMLLSAKRMRNATT